MILISLNISKMHYYIEVLKKYAVFKGRATRKEYWMFILFNFLAVVVLNIVEGFFSAGRGTSARGILVSVYQWVVLLPSIAVGIRRMHDVGKSGWYLLIPIYNFILTLSKSVGGNKYGPASN